MSIHNTNQFDGFEMCGATKRAAKTQTMINNENNFTETIRNRNSVHETRSSVVRAQDIANDNDDDR